MDADKKAGPIVRHTRYLVPVRQSVRSIGQHLPSRSRSSPPNYPQQNRADRIRSETKTEKCSYIKNELKSNGLLCSPSRPAYPTTSNTSPKLMPIINPHVR